MTVRRAADDPARERRNPGIAPTLRTSRPCAVTTSGASTRERDEPGRHEEVRVDDVGPRAPRATLRRSSR